MTPPNPPAPEKSQVTPSDMAALRHKLLGITRRYVPSRLEVNEEFIDDLMEAIEQSAPPPVPVSPPCKESRGELVELTMLLNEALERAVQWVPSNAVDTKMAETNPVSQCRTRAFCIKALEAYQVFPTKPVPDEVRDDLVARLKQIRFHCPFVPQEANTISQAITFISGAAAVARKES